MDIDETGAQGGASQGHGFERPQARQAGTHFGFGPHRHDAPLGDGNGPVLNWRGGHRKHPLGCVKNCHVRLPGMKSPASKYAATHSLPVRRIIMPKAI